MRDILGIGWAIVSSPFRIAHYLIAGDDFDRVIAEQAAELQRLAENADL